MTAKGLERCTARVRELELVVRDVQIKVGEMTTQSNETWHDNAPYDTLVQELGIQNQRLTEAHDAVRDYTIRPYPTTIPNKRVCYGSRVLLRRDNEELDLKIVGFGDSDYEKGRVLYTSPIAIALMDHAEGESFRAVINKVKSFITIEQVSPIADPDLI